MLASPVGFEPSPDYREVVRIIGLMKDRWAQGPATCEEENWQERERQTEIDVQIIERRMDPIEDRVVSKAAIDAESGKPAGKRK